MKQMKKLLGMLTIMLFALAGTQTTTYAATTANAGTSTKDAVSVKLNTEYATAFEKGSDSHYYKIKLDKEGFVQCHLTETTNMETELDVRIAYKDDAEYETTLELQNSTDRTHFVPLKKGTYYIRIDNETKNTCNYELEVKFVTVDGKMEAEGNHSKEDANKIDVGEVIYGAPNENTSDYYKFSVKEAGVVEIELNKGSKQGEIGTVNILSETGTKLSTFHIDAENEIYKSMRVGLKKGIYYAKVSIEDRDIVYDLKVNYKKSKYWEQEYNDDFDTPTPLTLGKTYNGDLREDIDYDWYSFEVKEDGYTEINLEFDTEKTKQTYDINLFTSSHHSMYTIKEIPITNGKHEKRVIGLKKGKYCIELSKYYSSPDRDNGDICANPYKLKITHKKTSKSKSANCEMEDNNSKETANAVSFGKEMSGATWGGLDGCDVYKFSVNADTYVNFTISHDKTEEKEKLWNVNIRNANAKVIVDKTVYTNDSSETSGTRKLSKGTYYVTVEQKLAGYQSNDYKLTLNKVKLKAPTISKVESTAYNKVKVSWKEVKGVSKYEIYRATSKNGKYKKVKTITNPKTTSWTDKKVKTGKTYYYKMKSVIQTTKDEKSSFSKMKFVKCVPATPEISLKAGKKQVKVSWKKVSGTNGYEVYRATSKDGKYKKVKTIKKGNTVSYTDKKVSSGKKYYYKVKAYRTVNGKKVYSNYSAVKSKKAK